MKKKWTEYLALCCLLSACMIFLYREGSSFYRSPVIKENLVRQSKNQTLLKNEVLPIVSKEETGKAEKQSFQEEAGKAEKQSFQETAGKEKKQSSQGKTAQEAFCRQVKMIPSEPVMTSAASDAVFGSAITLNTSDYECLLKIVESEAGICDQKGKILVANVVLNRMKSKGFPNTVKEVVYQKKQFSPVENGRIDRVSITEETKEAVSKALSGIDYSEGALFFVARSLADQKNVKWFDESLEFLFEHDGHEFFTIKKEKGG